jgi:adenylate cyclase class 2
VEYWTKSMSYEVELKYRLANRGALLRRLAERGAVAGASTVLEDVYLNHPARDFADKREALRIRRVGNENRITYKGPRLSGPTKTREEIEIAFASGDTAFEQLSRLLEILGFRPIATVKKSRMTFELTESGHRLEIAVDCALGLGDFAEIEAQAASSDALPAAQAAVISAAAGLGLTEVEPRSYLRMVLDRQSQAKSGGPDVENV